MTPDERAAVDRVALMVRLDHAVRNKEKCAQGDRALNNFSVAYDYQYAIEAVALQMQQDAADLAAVRKVEEWVAAKCSRSITHDGDDFSACGWNEARERYEAFASGESMIALGRALAAQEGA